MYAEFDVLADAEARATARVLEDRLRYRGFLEAGEAFVAEKGLVLGGSTAIRFLLARGGPLDAEALQYELYSGRALQHARELADRLYEVDPDGLGHYTTAVTKVENEIFVVSVDNRDLFTVASLPRVEGVRLVDLLEPVRRPAAFARGADGAPLGLRCAPPQAVLPAVYAALCSPARAADWPALLEAEAALRAGLGWTPRARRPPPERGPGWRRLREALGREFLGGASRVLLAPPGEGGRLQVVTPTPLEAEAGHVAELAAREGVSVQWKVNDVFLPADRRLRRATVFVAERGGREALLDLFNSAAYELVPYLEEPAARGLPRKVATEAARLKLRLADLWGVRLQAGLRKVAASVAAEAAEEIRADFLELAGALDAARAAAEADPEAAAPRLFPSAFVGRVEAADLALKRGAAGGFRHPPYLPVVARRREGGGGGAGGGGAAEDEKTAPAFLVAAFPPEAAAAREYAASLPGEFGELDLAGAGGALAGGALADALAARRSLVVVGAELAEALLGARLAGYTVELVAAAPTPRRAWLARLADAVVVPPAFERTRTGARAEALDPP